MSQNAPGQHRDRNAPYQEVFQSFAAPVDLTQRVVAAPSPTAPGGTAPYQNASSEFFVIVTTAGTFVWKDCTGTVRTITSLPIGSYRFPWAATSLEISTIVGAVIVMWHGSGAGRV
jgi:hypothetical protein